MSSSEQRPAEGWLHWLGRIGLWVVSAVVGCFAGILVGGVMEGHMLGWKLAGLFGASLIVAGWAGSDLPSPVRDLFVGGGLGLIGGSGFVVYLLGALPRC